GKYLAWRSQARAGFEADKWRLLVQDRQSGKTRDLTEKFDRSVGSFAMPTDRPPEHLKHVTPIVFSAEDHGDAPLFFSVLETDEPPTKLAPGHADDVTFGPNAVYFTRASISAPNEIRRLEFISDKPRHDVQPVTHTNDALLSRIDMQPLESFTFKGGNNEDVQGFIVKPP